MSKQINSSKRTASVVPNAKLSGRSKGENRYFISKALLLVPITLLLYLVIYLKTVGFTWRDYFSNYDNSLTVWSEAYRYFMFIFDGLDTVTSILGFVLNFIVEWFSKIIDYIVSIVEKVPKFSFGSIWSNLSQWAQNVIGGLFIK